MKKLKTTACMILVGVLCFSVIGCGNGSNTTLKSTEKEASNTGAWEDPSKPEVQPSGSAQWEDPTGDWVDPSNPGTKASESAQWEDPSKPIETTFQPSEPSGPSADGYRHEIDGWVFYTQHDIYDYIGYEDGKDRFDVAKMLEDIFGHPVVAISPDGNFCVKIDQRNNDVVLRLGKYDSSYNRKDNGWNGIEMWLYKYSLKIITPEKSGEKYYETGHSGYYATFELAEISLYVCENITRWGSIDQDAQGFIHAAINSAGYFYERFRVWENGEYGGGYQ